MENKVSASLTSEAAAEIKGATGVIENNLPPLISLTAEQRQATPKMGDKTLAFVYKALEYAKQNPELVPAFLDLTEVEKDVELVKALNNVLKPLAQLVEKLDDTTLQAGSEAYTAALVFYNSVKGAAKAGVPGTKSVYDDLQARFPGRSKAAISNTASKN
jgi:hypothetical protein